MRFTDARMELGELLRIPVLASPLNTPRHDVMCPPEVEVCAGIADDIAPNVGDLVSGSGGMNRPHPRHSVMERMTHCGQCLGRRLQVSVIIPTPELAIYVW